MRRAVSTNGLVQDVLHAALDALTARIAVVGKTGRIVLVNQAWRDTNHAASSLGLCRCGPGDSFLQSVQQSTLRCTDAWLVLRGVRDVLERRRAAFCRACRGLGIAWDAGLSIEVRSFEVSGSLHASVVLREMPPRRPATGCTERQILVRASDVIGPHTPVLTRMMDDLLGTSSEVRDRRTLRTDAIDTTAVIADVVETAQPMSATRGRRLFESFLPPKLARMASRSVGMSSHWLCRSPWLSCIRRIGKGASRAE